ncbi:MAG: aspartate--tRNA ligase [Caldisericota bacterium]|nr:aspartate--tRNA ligase [Caldisericota bacterium]
MLKRTINCADITEKEIGSSVTINGWIQKKRNLGGLLFLDIRDRSGIVQIVLNPDTVIKTLFKKFQTLKTESVIGIKGIVKKRETENPNLKTGKIEIEIETAEIFSEAEDLPFNPFAGQDVDEIVRLRYRYLDLRKPEVRKTFELRAKIVQSIRNYLIQKDFIDVETPILTKSTPEGARDFIVPSRLNKGKFYALPQSPQLFKQILMVGGFEKYFQIARCFRDEDLRQDRQPEFTQIDIEMSFVNQEDIMLLTEGMYKKMFKDVLDTDIVTPFPRIKYAEAMLRYGSDKPDTRFGMEIKDLTNFFKESKFNLIKNSIEKGQKILALFVPSCAKLSRKEIDILKEEIKEQGVAGFLEFKINDGISSSYAKYLDETEKEILLKNGKNNDIALLFIVNKKNGFEIIGKIRLFLARKFDLIPKEKWNFIWITDFPFFSFNKEENRYETEHHPFTMPNPEELDKIDEDKDNLHALAYDLALNGNEMGSGSIRIHNPILQKRVFNAIGLTEQEAENKFGFLLKALKLGAPPHGGIAFGLDRLVWIMSNAKSLRDVIAFPKTTAGISPLTDAPNKVKKEQLDDLGIQIKKR